MKRRYNIWTLQETQQLLELCIDLRRWYSFEGIAYGWETLCRLCVFASGLYTKNRQWHSNRCLWCPWVVFTKERCNRGRSYNITKRRRMYRPPAWCKRSIKRLNRWILLLKKRIRYYERKQL